MAEDSPRPCIAYILQCFSHEPIFDKIQLQLLLVELLEKNLFFK